MGAVRVAQAGKDAGDLLAVQAGREELLDQDHPVDGALYGARVGIWRTIDSLDKYGVRASTLLNSLVAEKNPQIIKAGVERDWAWLAHGSTNSILHTGLEPAEEREVLAEIVGTIESATGRRPKGWMGPALTETANTPALPAELGLSYVLDWTNDDPPYHLNVPACSASRTPSSSTTSASSFAVSPARTSSRWSRTSTTYCAPTPSTPAG
ncbi:polysaccharide deacetylase family protein [Kribbella sp. CA-294648]|uniref:polysaccharide deacetylase family protein n=1 Tax=Kribbella sp. CA-294648 TaxID=3239948 RepID=UPI003D8ABC4D